MHGCSCALLHHADEWSRAENKMKKKMLAISVAAVAAAGSAVAADLPRGPAPSYSPPAPSIYNWSGFYAGLNLGYEWGKVTSSVDPAGVAGGGQLGYNWQTGQFVFGAETDSQVSAADDTFAPWKFSNLWFGTLRGRAGYAMNNILLFATAGLAYGNLKAEAFRDRRKQDARWLDCRAWNGSRLHAELVGQS